MRELLGSVTLRNQRNVYLDGRSYLVEQIGRGQLYTVQVARAVVDHLQSVLAGRVVTVEDAAAELEPIAERFRLPYTYGHKLQFYVQDALVVMVARGTADFEQVGRRFLYTVHAPAE